MQFSFTFFAKSNWPIVVPSKLSIWVWGLTAANLSAINRNMTTVQQMIPSRLTVFFFTDGHHGQPQCNAAHLTCSNFNIKPSLTSIVVNNPTRHTTVLLSQLSLLFLRKKKEAKEASIAHCSCTNTTQQTCTSLGAVESLSEKSKA